MHGVYAAGMVRDETDPGVVAASISCASACEIDRPAALMLDGDPSTFARFEDSTPQGRPVTCSFTIDLGRERSTCGLRIVSQPDRWITTAPAGVRVTACDDPDGRRPKAKLAEDKRLHPAFAGESQLVFWPRTSARYYRVEVLDAGMAAINSWGLYHSWGDWHARRMMGLPSNGPNEPRIVDIAEVELLDGTPEDAPVWNAHPSRAFPEGRLKKDWLLQDFGWDGFAKASATNDAAYYAVCRARRAKRLARIAAECPKIVYVKHYTISGDAELSGNALVSDESCILWPRNWRKGGQLCMLTVNADGSVSNEVLVDCPEGCIRDPDVSHDGKKVLFSMRRSFGSDTGVRRGPRRWADYVKVSGDDYHLYVFDLETRQTKQLTFSDPARCCDFEGIWTSGGKIVFESTRCVQIIPCHRNEAANLYVCDADGRNIRRLGYDGGATIGAQELADGRILYTRYEYNDRSARLQQPLFTMNPDGTAQMEYYGNNSRFPTSLIHFRQIPGTEKVLGIIGGHHVAQKGKLVVLDRSRGTQGDAGISFVAGSDIRERGAVVPSDYDRDPVYLQCRAKHDPYVEDFGAIHGAQWQNPYPLSETEWITGFVPEGSLAGTKCGDNPNFGIYWQNAQGERELLAYDPAIECSQPVPARPRAKARAPRYVPWNPKAAYGTFHVQDVYEGPGLDGVKRGTVKRLRVVGVESRPAYVAMGLMYADWDKEFDRFIAYNGDLSGEGVAVAGGTWDVKHVLGEAEVSPDGSCTFEAPACTPVYFQLLDADGYCVQTMRSWATLMPGEYQGCVGCHESKTGAPRVAQGPRGAVRVQRLQPSAGQVRHPLLARLDRFGRLSTAADFAGIHGASPLDPDAPTTGFSYPRLVQPILDRHCARCHDGKDPARPDLRGVEAKKRALNHPERVARGCKDIDGRRRFTESYLSLTSRGKLTPRLNWPSSSSVSEMIPPYAMGSGRSTIMKKFGGGHHGAKPSDEERRLFACWIDLGVPFGGSYCEATDWTDDERRAYGYHQLKRAAFAESERLSELALPADRQER